MGDQKDDRRLDSLTPIAIEKEGIDLDVAAMNKGNKGRIVMFVAVFLLAAGGSAALLSRMDEKGNYSEAGKAVNSIKKTEFDRFWGCALTGVDLREIKSNADLMARIQERSRANSILYARQMRDRCLDILLSAESRLEPSLFPSDLQGLVKDMKVATIKMREAWNQYITYLTNPSTEFDEAKATAFEQNIASGWYAFLKGHADVNGILRKKLQ